MADDPQKRKQDGNTVSSQKHELDYLREKVRENHPRMSQDRIEEAIREARKAAQPSESRKKIMEDIEKRLS